MTAAYKFSTRSLEILGTVDRQLQECAKKALFYSEIDFGIISGMRSAEEQARLVAVGASKTHRSKHLTGEAVDIMAWMDHRPCWEPEVYRLIAPAWELAARDTGLVLTWGGNWGWDFGHFEIAGRKAIS